MQFRLHGSGAVKDIKVDWNAPVELTPEIRAAMAPHDLDQLHAGVLRRGFVLKGVTYPSGTIAFRVADHHEMFLQVPAGEERVPAKVDTKATEWTVDELATGARHRVVVGTADQEERADARLPKITGLSRAVLQRLIEEGHVTLAAAPLKKSHRLRIGDVIEILVPKPAN
ncbi:MAG: hypothetical protein JWO36_4614 [Myxococcales bacterium]|nr:hypothetical protein [Myxococcales bacterium]